MSHSPPKAVEIPARAVREATPSELAAKTIERTGDMFTAVSARPVVAATEARFRDLTSGEPMEANEIIWFGWAEGDPSPVPVRLDDLTVAIEPASGAASVRDVPAERIEDLRIRDLTSGEPLLVFATGAAGPFLRFRRRIQVALLRFFARIAQKSESGMADPCARPRPD